MAREKRRPAAVRVFSADTLLGPRETAVPLDPEGVHRVRRRIKHVRAVLKLAADAGAPGAKRLRAVLGVLAKRIAPMRDTAVVVRLAAKWVQKPGHRFQDVAAILTETAEPQQPGRWWRSWWNDFAKARHGIDEVGRGTSLEALHPAVNRSIRRVIKRHRRARVDDIERMHRWRKAVIVLREQLGFLRPALDAKANRLYQSLDALGKTLGHVIDAQVLIDALENCSWRGEIAGVAEKFVKHLRKKQRRAACAACAQWPEIAAQLKRVRD